MPFPRLATVIIITSLFSACTALPAPNSAWHSSEQRPEFDATGRMGIQTEQGGHYAQFHWLNTQAVQSIDIRVPIGGSIGKLCADHDGAQLTTYNGQMHRADNLTELSQNLLGHTLPIAHLDRWVNGQIVPNEAHSFTSEGHLKQSGWLIQRQIDEQGRPRLVLLERPELRLRLAFSEFATPNNPPTRCTD